jgi:hypothetical protein
MTDGLYTFGTLETVEIPQGGPGLANNPKPLCPIGVLYRHQGNVYRYVHYVNPQGTGNVGDNMWLADAEYWYALDPVKGIFDVCPDSDDSIAGINALAGIGRLPDPGVDVGNYTFIQVGGITPVRLTAPANAGDKMIGSAAIFDAASIALGAVVTDCVFGVIIEPTDPSTGYTMVLLQNLIW